MAIKKPSQKRSDTTVTRVIASDKSSSTKTKTKSVAAPKKPVIEAAPAKKPSLIAKLKAKRTKSKKDDVNYFVGAWRELKQVRWPDRRATWGYTVALVGYVAFFVIVILLLDALFKYLFELVIG